MSEEGGKRDIGQVLADILIIISRFDHCGTCGDKEKKRYVCTTCEYAYCVYECYDTHECVRNDEVLYKLL